MLILKRVVEGESLIPGMKLDSFKVFPGLFFHDGLQFASVVTTLLVRSGEKMGISREHVVKCKTSTRSESILNFP